MQAHAEYESGVGRVIDVGSGRGLLELDGGAQRINRAGEFDQGTVARQFDQTASVFGQNRIEVFGSVVAQARQRPLSPRPIRRE